MQTDIEQAWACLLDYRSRVTGWHQSTLSLADTRLRVARLLDAGFGFGWDVEADVRSLDHQADFALHVAGERWGVVLVRAMGTGTGEGPPPEAFVLADGAGCRWTWVTDGVAVVVFHVDQDLVARQVLTMDLAAGNDADLRRIWELMSQPGVARGRLETYRRSRLRPGPQALRQALQDPAVLQAMRQVLATTFPNPGSDDELLDQMRHLFAEDDDPPIGPASGPASRPDLTAEHPDEPDATAPEPASPQPCMAIDPTVQVATELPAPVSAAPELAAPESLPESDLQATQPSLPGPNRKRRQAPSADSLLTAMEKQRQTHERLRQNLQDLKDNRARLQDALTEMQRDEPERLERRAAERAPQVVGAGAPSASWTLLGHLQAMGNGYWEWSAADEGGPGVRLN